MEEHTLDMTHADLVCTIVYKKCFLWSLSTDKDKRLALVLGTARAGDLAPWWSMPSKYIALCYIPSITDKLKTKKRKERKGKGCSKVLLWLEALTGCCTVGRLLTMTTYCASHHKSG